MAVYSDEASAAPSGTAAGGLGGTYPNPTVDLNVGVAGGQNLIGGTVSGDTLIVKPNSADAGVWTWYTNELDAALLGDTSKSLGINFDTQDCDLLVAAFGSTHASGLFAGRGVIRTDGANGLLLKTAAKNVPVLIVTGANGSDYEAARFSTDPDTVDATVNVATLKHNATNGTAANGIGTGLLFASEDTAGNDQNVAVLRAVLTTATSTSEEASLRIGLVTGGAALPAEGSEKFAFTGTGRLGIGTVSPAKALHLFSASADVTALVESQNNFASYSLKNNTGSQGDLVKYNSTALGGDAHALSLENNTGPIRLKPGGSNGLDVQNDLDTKFYGFGLAKVTAGITASTTQTQGQGVLVSEANQVTVCANANDTVTAPAAVAGRRFEVTNLGANNLQLFPASGDAFRGSAVDASIVIGAGLTGVFRAFDATTWEIL